MGTKSDVDGAVTPDLRAIAEEINRLHKDRPGTYALAPDYRYVGLAGQDALARMLGVETDLSINGGDGGKDMFVRVRGKLYKIDAKTSRLPHLGMLVPVEAKPDAKADIYAFMSFPELECWGWASRARVERAPVVVRRRGPCYEVPNGWLRHLDELLLTLGRIDDHSFAQRLNLRSSFGPASWRA